MDVLIKGLALPTGGGSYHLTINSIGNVIKAERIGYHAYTAIELPPHGRLIDAEKLQAVLYKWEEDARGRDNIELAYAYKTVREIIDDRDCVVEANNGSNN